MQKPTLYRKEPLTSVKNRITRTISTEQRSQVEQTVSKFFELFIIKHM